MSELDKLFIDVSKTFKTAVGRHTLKTVNVAYCSFSTDAISMAEEKSQRNAKKRLERFGVTTAMLHNQSVLDLGSHYGAMLFQLTNYGISTGLGIEYDCEKVDLANAICRNYAFTNLKFIVADIDKLSSEQLGQYDIVLALSIDKHLKNRQRLFELIGSCARKICLFEGNAGCDIDRTVELFKLVGFSNIEYKGYCNDDVRAENNRRPNFIACK